jgi:carboxypeptidase C (cathepsin A)
MISIANIVYLEQPAFVGWSYSNTSSDRNTGDKRATIDNYAFVQVCYFDLFCFDLYFSLFTGFLELVS